jgi:hypothetical protein
LRFNREDRHESRKDHFGWYFGAHHHQLGGILLPRKCLREVTKVNRINGIVAIQRTQSGTVRANKVAASSSSATEEFKAQEGLWLAFSPIWSEISHHYQRQRRAVHRPIQGCNP